MHSAARNHAGVSRAEVYHTSGDFDLVSPVTVAPAMPVGAALKGPITQPGYGHSVRDEEVQGLAIFTVASPPAVRLGRTMH